MQSECHAPVETAIRLKLNSIAKVQGRCGRAHARVARPAADDELDRVDIRSFLRTLHFTSDGTSIVAQDDEHQLYTYVLPTDLLDADEPHRLKPWASTRSASPVLSYAAYPSYNLQDTSTTWLLSSARELPIQLRNALAYDYPGNTYPWIHRTTEAYLSANSLAFTTDGSHFIAGTRGYLGVFDVSRSGEGPVTTHKTGGRRGTAAKQCSRDNGLIMALALASDGLVAAGSTNRKISVWSASGHGDMVTSFPLTPPASVKDDCPGTGVHCLAWSPCQRYLLVAERQSDCIQVFDVRNGGQRLSYLARRNAMSTQRFDMSLIPTPSGYEVWSGGIDGTVRMWSNPGSTVDEQPPQAEIKIGELPVGGISWHPQGAVLATSSGGFLSPATTEDEPIDSAAYAETSESTIDTMNIWMVI